jgi:alpha-galactosidase
VQVDAERFPSGMKALGEYIHSRGLKFGIYSSAGIETCVGERPGSLDYESIDANMYASWGVDLLKYDNCYNGLGLSKTSNVERYTGIVINLFIMYNITDAMIYSHARCA